MGHQDVACNLLQKSTEIFFLGLIHFEYHASLFIYISTQGHTSAYEYELPLAMLSSDI